MPHFNDSGLREPPGREIFWISQEKIGGSGRLFDVKEKVRYDTSIPNEDYQHALYAGITQKDN